MKSIAEIQEIAEKSKRWNKDAEKPIAKKELDIDGMARRCEVAIESAAHKGKRYCEVGIDSQAFDALRMRFSEFNPTINGDGYSITVICFRW